MIDEQSSASEHDCASDRAAIGAGINNNVIAICAKLNVQMLSVFQTMPVHSEIDKNVIVSLLNNAQLLPDGISGYTLYIGLKNILTI